MRILHVVEATIAGIRRHVSTLASGLDRQLFEVTVACPPRRESSFGDVQFVEDLQRAGVAVVSVAMTRAIAPGADARALRDLVRLMRAGRYDIVHTHSSKAGFLGRLAARIAGAPATIYTPNGLFFLGLPPSPRRRFYLALERLAARLGDRIVAVSPGEREVILRYRIAPADRVVCIENGIAPIGLPSDYDRAAQRRALGALPDNLLIGTLARMEPQKNPFMFLEAAALALRGIPNARFVWCGGGALADAAQARAQARGIAHACAFLGHREDALGILAALDLFWLTSDYEGMPYALLEAMALRLPIVATDAIGSRDLLGGTAGLLVPRGDARALAAATRLLARSPERRDAFARAAHARYAGRYTADRMLRTTAQLYTELAGMRSSRLEIGLAPAQE